MKEFALLKVQNGFQFANPSDREATANMRLGSYCTAKIQQPRNPLFHRRFFALLNLGFEYWSPDEEHRGIKAEKNFDRFRKDILILAGFRETVVNIRNEVRYEAKSISFASMDEVEFNDVYKKCFNVIWEMVMQHVKGFTEEQMEQAVNQLMSFD